MTAHSPPGDPGVDCGYTLPPSLRETIDRIHALTRPIICHPDDQARIIEPGTMYLIAPDPFVDGQILSAGKIQTNT